MCISILEFAVSSSCSKTTTRQESETICLNPFSLISNVLHMSSIVFAFLWFSLHRSLRNEFLNCVRDMAQIDVFRVRSDYFTFSRTWGVVAISSYPSSEHPFPVIPITTPSEMHITHPLHSIKSMEDRKHERVSKTCYFTKQYHWNIVLTVASACGNGSLKQHFAVSAITWNSSNETGRIPLK